MRPLAHDCCAVGLSAACGAVLLRSGQVILESGPATGGTGATSVSGYVAGAAGLTATALGLVIMGWWAAAFLLAFASQLLQQAGFRTAGTRTGRLAPASMKRIAAAFLGLNLLAGTTAGPAFAALPAGSAQPAVVAASAGAGDAGPLWSAQMGSEAARPLWKPVAAPIEPAAVIPRQQRVSVPEHRPTEIVVRPGDSLWSIAATQLGPFATDTEIAAEWPRWFRTNRQIIGADPGLIRPGQVLRAPGGP